MIFLNSAWKLNGDFFDASLFIYYLSQCACMLSHVPLFMTPRTLQAPLSMGFFRQEYWSGLPFPPPGHLPNLGKEPVPPALADGFFFLFVCYYQWATWEAHLSQYTVIKETSGTFSTLVGYLNQNTYSFKYILFFLLTIVLSNFSRIG